MNSFSSIFRRLFSADGFVPRRVCGLWPDWLVWEHIAGNALICLAYVALPVMIWRLGTRRSDRTPFKGVVLSFALFIGLCGVGHFLDMLAFFYPMYRLSGLVLVATGLVSGWTAWSIRRAWPDLMAMKSPAELEHVIAERTEELSHALDDLRLAELDRASLATLVESSDDAIIGKDLDGLVTTWNGGAERIFGYSAAEAVGRPMTFLFPPDLLGEEAAILDRLRHGERVDHYESVRLTKDGRSIDVSLTISPIKDRSEEIVGFSKIARDITDRKDAEAQIRLLNEGLEARVRERTAELTLAVENFERAENCAQNITVREPLLMLDSTLRVRSANRAFYQSFHVSPEETEGRLIYELGNGQWDIPDLRTLLDDIAPQSSVFDDFELVHTFPTIGRRVMLLNARKLEAGNHDELLVLAMEDVTERRLVEEEVAKAKEAAEAANRAKSAFLANMSHEIRTPMNGVLGMTELLLDTQLNDLQRGYAETIHSSGEALLTVINDILDFSKIEAGKLTLESTDFDLRALMEEVADLLTPGARRKNLKINCLVAREVPRRLEGDPVRIRQVLTNLAGNAVKFTERGEVDLEAHHLDDDGGGVTLRILVRDTGMGVPVDRQADIFESFTQIEGGNCRQHGGTGLGLTICRSLVALMGGRIGLESRTGEGSTFWFELAFAKGYGEADLSSDLLDGLRVLVVDDQERDSEILREMLLSWGCRPEVVASGPEALATLLADPNDNPFGFILIDQDMPGMDGEQTGRIIRAAFRYAKVPLVLFTTPGLAGADTGEVEDGLWTARMTKPVCPSLLYNTFCRTVSDPEGPHTQHAAGGAGMMKLHSPLRILLAEDNEVNREVAIGMVERLGCEVEAVWNGREAIEALDYERHDLILMDVQMPEMDGLAATAAIREREWGTDRHITIIALTAHAMQGDRDRCAAAGMDDYISKPIRPGPLCETLRTWGGKVEQSPNKAVRCQEPELPTSFAESLGASCGNDPTLTRKVLELMLKGVPVRLERLGAAINAGDESRRSGEAHSLKGAFATVGAQALASACQEMMSLHEGEESAAIAKVHRLIRDQWVGLEKEATHYLEVLRS